MPRKHLILNRDAVIVADPAGDLFAVTIHPKCVQAQLVAKLTESTPGESSR